MKGSFSRIEVESLKKSILSYISEHSISKEEFITLCSESAKDQVSITQAKNAWCQIAEALQNRSVQSIHNYCRRVFNPANYGGKWAEDEEQALLDAVQILGNSWKAIASVLNDQFEQQRTAENVKDKYKSLGGRNAD